MTKSETMTASVNELKNVVALANTANADGRQAVVNACKKLYNLVEVDFTKVGADCLLDDMYTDLTTGNFAEPYLCEMKKNKFTTYATIYTEHVMPQLY